MEAMKDKLRSSNVHAKDLAKELSALRLKHEEVGKEHAVSKQRVEDGKQRFQDLATEAQLTRDELNKCESDLSEVKKQLVENKVAADEANSSGENKEVV